MSAPVAVFQKQSSTIIDQLKKSPLNFVAAKRPEAVSTRPTSYIHIKPASDSNDQDSDLDTVAKDFKVRSSSGQDQNQSISAEPKEQQSPNSASTKDSDSDYEDAINFNLSSDDNSVHESNSSNSEDENDDDNDENYQDDEETDNDDESDEQQFTQQTLKSIKGPLSLESLKLKQATIFQNSKDISSSGDENSNSEPEEEKTASSSEIKQEPAQQTKNESIKENSKKDDSEITQFMTRGEKLQWRLKNEKELTDEVNSKYNFVGINSDNNARSSHLNRRIRKTFPPGMQNPSGLMNNGVTCYMNSAIQSLFHLPAMCNYLQDVFNGKYQDSIPSRSVTRDLAHLFHRMTSPNAKFKNKRHSYDSSVSNRAILPTAIIRRLDDINPLMSEWNQEDSHEYLMSLIGRLQEDSVPKGKKLNSSILYDMFGGTFLQTVICQECKNKSETHQDFFDIQVSIDKEELDVTGKATLNGSIRQYFSNSFIKKSKTDGYDCEKCHKKTNALTYQRIERAPEYLVISIKRFEYTGKHSYSQKIKQNMAVSKVVELTPFSWKNTPMKYELMAFTVHEGRSASSGHYVAYCRQQDNTWALYDDELVERVPISRLNKTSKDDIYFLIYSKVDAVPLSEEKGILSDSLMKQRLSDRLANIDGNKQPAMPAEKPKTSDSFLPVESVTKPTNIMVSKKKSKKKLSLDSASRFSILDDDENDSGPQLKHSSSMEDYNNKIQAGIANTFNGKSQFLYDKKKNLAESKKYGKKSSHSISGRLGAFQPTNTLQKSISMPTLSSDNEERMNDKGASKSSIFKLAHKMMQKSKKPSSKDDSSKGKGHKRLTSQLSDSSLRSIARSNGEKISKDKHKKKKHA